MPSKFLLLLLFSLAPILCNVDNGEDRMDTNEFETLVNSLRFWNSGTVSSRDRYVMRTIVSIYNEGYMYFGQGSRLWQMPGLPYLFKVPNELSRGNASFRGYSLTGEISTKFPQLVSWELCEDNCVKIAASSCAGWSFNGTTGDCSLYRTLEGEPIKTEDLETISGCGSLIQPSESCIPTAYLESPPSGMRSAVPLGGLGGGSFELRADGRWADWTAINNGPSSPFEYSGKIDADEASFAMVVEDQGRLIQTHPMHPIPGVDSITYQGAFPTARLSCEVGGVNVQLNGLSAFAPHDSEISATPGALFVITLNNTRNASTTVSFSAIVPNLMMDDAELSVIEDRGLGFEVFGDDPSNGQMAIVALGNSKFGLSYHGCKDDFEGCWEQYIAARGQLQNQTELGSRYALVSLSGTIGPREAVVLKMGVGWYFPHNKWGKSDLGRQYENWFESAKDVSEYLLQNAWNIVENSLRWQRLWDESNGPDWMKDFLVNGAGGLLKTSMWLRDGRWRQFESHSCAQLEPPHIHFYRSLAFQLFFPTLERQTLELYGKLMDENGMISECCGCGCEGCEFANETDIDTAKFGARGDDNSVYILDIFMNWRWAADGNQFLHEVHSQLFKAVKWQIGHSLRYGLVADLSNTFDEHYVMGNINTYSGALYLTAMAACEIMGSNLGNLEMQSACANALAVGSKTLLSHLWTGNFFRSFWCANEFTSLDALQGGVMYGFVWADLLGLFSKLGIDSTNVVSHLAMERKRNFTPFGIQFCTGRTTAYDCNAWTSEPGMRDDISANFTDHDVWESHSIEHGILSLYHSEDTHEQLDGLDVAKTVINKYREILNDQWDYRDLSSTYPDAPNEIRPVCNSHYTRQLIGYALPLAMTKQSWNARTKELTLAPPISSSSWPILLPTGFGLLNADFSEIEWLSGYLDAEILLVHNVIKAKNITLKQNQKYKLAM